MAKLGDSVLYVGTAGKQVSLVTKLNPDNTIDLAVWEGEAWTPKTNVPRSDDGGGHTWQPVGAGE